LRKISGALAHLTVPDRLADLIVRIVVRSMRLKGGAAFIYDNSKNGYVYRAGFGKCEEYKSIFLANSSPIVQEIIGSRSILNLAQLAKKKEASAVVREMQSMKTALCVPAFSRGKKGDQKLLAVLCLSAKRSGEKFTKEDIDLFGSLSFQASIALENALLHQQQIRDREKMVESEKMAALGTMAAGIVHELRNPLAFLLTSAEILGFKGDDKEFRENTLKMFVPEVKRMNNIIGTLLDYARQHEMRRVPTDIHQLLEKIILMVTFDTRRLQVKIKKDFKAQLQPLGEESRMMQVFLNLVNNAIQAMPKGGEITLVTEDLGNMTRVQVIDTGEGITPENLQRISSPFFTTKEKGTGLGLAITRKILEEHLGRLEITSELGKGSVFSVYLPNQI
jgi:signal transduction histidine kinase